MNVFCLREGHEFWGQGAKQLFDKDISIDRREPGAIHKTMGE